MVGQAGLERGRRAGPPRVLCPRRSRARRGGPQGGRRNREGALFATRLGDETGIPQGPQWDMD